MSGAGAAYREFHRAVEDYTARPNSAGPIAAMMRLALDGGNPTIAAWASTWLKATCNIAILSRTAQGKTDATSPAATSIL